MKNRSGDISLEQIRKLYGFCRFYIFVNLLAVYFLMAGFLCGTAIIVTRYIEAPFSLIYVELGIAIICALASATVRAGKFELTETDIASLIDKKVKAGGLIMMLFDDIPIPGWEDKVEFRLPKLKTQWMTPFIYLLGAALFAAACIIIPIPRSDPQRVKPRLDISKQADDLKTKIETLSDTGSLNQKERERFEKILKELEENSAALQPAKVYESLDTVESALKNVGDNSARELMSGSQLMKKMEMAVEHLETTENPELEKKLRKWAKELTEQLKNSPEIEKCCLPMKGGLKANELLKAMLKNPPPTDKKMLKKLVQMMKKGSSCSDQSLKKLLQSGSCSQQLSQIKKFLEQNEQKYATGEGSGMKLTKTQQDALKQMLGFGDGGITRGSGDAPMFFGEETPQIAIGKQERVKSNELNPELGETIGLSFAAPEVKPIDDGGQGTLETKVGSGGQARKYRISPSNRKIVKKYFTEIRKDHD